MAKRHHNSKALHGYYEGPSERRHQEMMDGGMIHEDRTAVANLPQMVMYKPYPRNDSYLHGKLDDTITGIDHQISTLDGAKRDAHLKPKKV